MTTVQMEEQIRRGNYDERFCDIYGCEEEPVAEKVRYMEALKAFRERFGEMEVEIFSAPGRTEIGGNHTDHQQGKVLAAAVHLDVIGVVAKTAEERIVIRSDGFPEIVTETHRVSKEDEEEGTSGALVKGVVAGLKEKGYKVGGFLAYVTSNVPVGSGLSSSAAFETLVATILSGTYNQMSVSPKEIAIIGKYAENIYFGKPCGLMDQMACSFGNLVYIDFKNMESPKVERLEFAPDEYGYRLCITDTKGSHADLTKEYAEVPSEMKSVANYFGKQVLREITREELFANMQQLRGMCGDRAVLRALHFVNENIRVEKEAEALKSGNIKQFLESIKASGDSSYKYLQNVYTNRDIQHQNISLALAVSEMYLGENGVCRVHGGGFAGTIQAFVKQRCAKEYRKHMDSVFGQGACVELKVRKCGGIKVIG